MSGSSSLRHLLNPEPHTRRDPPSSPPPRHDDNPSYQHRQPSLSTTNFDSDSDKFDLLENSEDEEHPADMALSARYSTRSQSVVDLTDTPDTQPTSQRRKRSSDEGPVKKRQRTTRREPIEEIDLVDENPSVEEELLQAQQQATIRAHQAEVDAGPQKLGKLQCIICMESYTDATATACGHFYCHECLHQSLLVGEKGDDRKGTCPVCRKFISRKKKTDIIPMSFMKKSTFLEQQKRNVY